MHRVLITGATGFIGGRLVEHLARRTDVEIVALVHQYRNLARLARFPVRVLRGDVRDPVAVATALDGCTTVVNCAMSSSGTPVEMREVIVQGIKNICQSAKAGQRIVHISSFSVYGTTPPGNFNEVALRPNPVDAYGRAKLEAEAIVHKYAQSGVAAIILQPTIVYGPNSNWSRQIGEQVATKAVLLPSLGSHSCNAVYVDDVVSSILLCFEADRKSVGPFLISGNTASKWSEFYRAHWIGEGELDIGELDVASIRRLRNEKGLISQWQRAVPKILNGLKTAAGEVPNLRDTYYRHSKRARINLQRRLSTQSAVQPFSNPTTKPRREHLSLLTSDSVVCIDKAINELKFAPKYDLVAGGRITRQWLKWIG